MSDLKWHEEARGATSAWEAFSLSKQVVRDFLAHAVEPETKMALLAIHGQLDACEALTNLQDEVQELEEQVAAHSPDKGSNESS